jgi:hypothetical protein
MEQEQVIAILLMPRIRLWSRNETAKGPAQVWSNIENLTFQHDGIIFGAYGHLHDGGDMVIVAVNGKTICESKTEYSGKANRAT